MQKKQDHALGQLDFFDPAFASPASPSDPSGPLPKAPPRPLDETRRDESGDPDSGPVGDAGTDFLAAFLAEIVAEGKSRHTAASLRLDLLQLERFLDRTPLESVTLAHLRAFVRWLREERDARPSTLRRKIATIKSFSAFLARQG